MGSDITHWQHRSENARRHTDRWSARSSASGLYSGLTMETTLDPNAQPFLHDHQIDGTPVLPGVMGIEAFAEAALCMLPDWHIEAIEEVNFLAPFKFYRRRAAHGNHSSAIMHSQRRFGDCRLPTDRQPHAPQSDRAAGDHALHRPRAADQAAAASRFTADSSRDCRAEAVVEAADIYRVYFHGPAYQVLERAWWDGNRMVGLMARSLPDNHRPADLPTLMAPRLIELCFQTAGSWEWACKAEWACRSTSIEVRCMALTGSGRRPRCMPW